MTEQNQSHPEKLALTSMDVNEDRIEALRELFPEAFKEGTIDWQTLQRSLGESIDPAKERFGLNWPGKAECMRVIQQPSIGTLLPVRVQSVNFDSTENMIIEGDNLETLKLLQKSYYGKVKMIYIDPPYNTGNEFIYPDNFQEGLQEYLRYSGQVDAEGLKLSTNTETDGRFHSKWLNMIYPRLFLARNLLRDDGVLLVSIDDHEAHNLRQVLGEIYGEENIVATFVWQKKYSRDNRPVIGTVHEYIFLVARNAEDFARVRNLLPPSEESTKVYRNPNNDPRGRWRPVPLTAQAGHATASQFYEIVTPGGAVHRPSEGRCWAVSRDTFDGLLRDKRVWFGKDGNAQPNLIRYLTEIDGFVPWTWLPSNEVGHTDEAKKELYALLGKENGFETPKPSRLIRHFLQLATNANTNDIVLDFFAGTGTTADAVVQQNTEDGGNRRFILVQLPEPTDSKDFPTIADIAKKRVSSRIEAIVQNTEGNLAIDAPEGTPLGYRVYRLSTSNFRVWDSASERMDNLNKTLQLFADHVDEGREAEDILYELLLKAGFPLTSSLEKLTLAGKEVFSVSDGALLICLDRTLTLEVIEAMVEKDPARIICLDEGFKGNDQLKVNAVQTVKSRNQNEETDIVFRVV